MIDDPIDDDTTTRLAVLLGAAARRALHTPDGADFVGWFADVLPLLCPDMVAAMPADENLRRSIARAMGRLLWNRIPLPDQHFRPRPLPKPERNAPCPCGSGRKYKHCCAQVEAAGDPFEGVSMLQYVLEQFPRTRLKTLPLAGIDLEELGFVASQWNRADRSADVEALLEPVFEDVDHLDARAELAFDALANGYDALGRARKKARLVERVAAARDPTLRSAALHRRITMLADRGERAKAWRLFGEAQRHQPDNPMLATLELTMLLEERDYARLRERGRFWIGRLGRERGDDCAALLGHIRALVADPPGAALSIMASERPAIAALSGLLAAMPPASPHYRLQSSEAVVCLEPTDELAALTATWRSLTAVRKPDLTLASVGDGQALERVAAAIPWLTRHPLAWQSFEVLDDLALAIQDAQLGAGEERLLGPVVERARALLQTVLRDQAAAGRQLPWGFPQNRPALRLLVALFFHLRGTGRSGEAYAVARELVFELNPSDNHGLRNELAGLCFEAGDAQGAFDVCARFPDDALAATQLDRVLALYLLDRRDEAADALRSASAHSPKALPLLFADAPKPARQDGPFVRLGGREEAYEYRESRRTLWEKSGALDWARSIRIWGGGRP